MRIQNNPTWVNSQKLTVLEKAYTDSWPTIFGKGFSLIVHHTFEIIICPKDIYEAMAVFLKTSIFTCMITMDN
jgi:hypothetical protein